jgi:hypothetical protein
VPELARCAASASSGQLGRRTLCSDRARCARLGRARLPDPQLTEQGSAHGVVPVVADPLRDEIRPVHVGTAASASRRASAAAMMSTQVPSGRSRRYEPKALVSAFPPSMPPRRAGHAACSRARPAPCPRLQAVSLPRVHPRAHPAAQVCPPRPLGRRTTADLAGPGSGARRVRRRRPRARPVQQERS